MEPKDKAIVESVLQQAEQFAWNHEHCTYQDYERFKHMLQSNGIYGYESDIADILGI